jgi:hypothetical protein
MRDRSLHERPETGDDKGSFLIFGQARVALAGAFNACWVVETGDFRALSGFWAL